jgi:hypothetical protein
MMMETLILLQIQFLLSLTETEQKVSLVTSCQPAEKPDLLKKQ